MCYPIRCPDCGKTGWAGCGQHIDEVMHTVPVAQRCGAERISSTPDGITQNSEAIPVLGFADLTSREPCGQYLLRRRRLLASPPVAGHKDHQSYDAGDNQRPEQHHPDAHSGVSPPAHVVVVPEHDDHFLGSASSPAIVVVTAGSPQSRKARSESLCIWDY